MFNKKYIKKVVKALIYWTLCISLNPNSRGLDPYKNLLLKKKITKRLAGMRNNRSAARILVSGRVVGVGFESWLRRRARLNGLESWVRIKGRDSIEALLAGEGVAIETVIRAAWKGPKRAKVVKIREQWFNKPKKSGSKKKAKAKGVSWSQGTADCIVNTVEQIDFIKEGPNYYPEEDERLVGADELIRAANERNLFYIRCLNKDIYFVSPVKEVGLQRSKTTRVSTIVHSLTDHKQLAKDFLEQSGLPVPQGRVFTDLKSAKAYLKSVGRPVVVKPAAGLNGSGVTVDVRTQNALVAAWEYARKYHEEIVVEELVQGVDIRVVIVGGAARAALLRVPANVVGDGVKTVERLLDEKNMLRLGNPRLSKNMIIPNAYSDSYLERQGHTWESVPEKGEAVFLHLKANICEGADSISVTDLIHPDLMRLAEEAASVFGIDDYWGIDLLVERIDLPRDEQHCAIIELNSTANIENVIYPLYGPTFDSARCLVDHIFPEDTSDTSYPIETVQARVSGYFNISFSEWAKERADELNIDGSIKAGDSVAEIVLSGRRHNVLTYLDELLDWKGEANGFLADGLTTYPYDREVKAGFFVEEGRPEDKSFHTKFRSSLGLDQMGKINFDQAGESKDGHPFLEAGLFIEEFKAKGYKAAYLYEDLIEIRKDGAIGVTGMHHSSLFCDRVCNRIYPAKKLLALNGLPVLRGVRFRARHWQRALEYFMRLSRPAIVTSLHPHQYESYLVNDEKELRCVWKRARKTGASRLLIEEYFNCWNVFVAVIAGKAVGEIIAEPVTVCGDGISTVEQLIEKKNEERALNPYYSEKLIAAENHLNQRLALSDRGLNTVMDRGESLILESPFGLEFGGETASIEGLLHADFKEKAVQAVSAIPGLEFAVVQMLIPDPEGPAEGQRWAIYKIDTRPATAAFHFPGRGKPCKLAGVVVSELCLTERTRWLKRGNKADEKET